MDDRQRLLQWMEANEVGVSQLARTTGDFKSSISYMIHGHREINQAFKWRFGKAYGFDVAEQIFVDEPIKAETV